MLANEAYNRTGNLNGIGYATIKIPWVKGLSYTATYSKTLNTSETGSFYGFNTYQGQGPKGTGSRAYSRGTATLFDHLIKYNRTFAEKHNVDLTLLHSDQKTEAYGESLSASGFDNDQLGTYRLSAGAIQAVSTSGSETQSIGQMARLTYTYDGKYSVTGTIRHDGYSAFSANHKYGNFSSVGVNWNISKEKFMENVKAVQFTWLCVHLMAPMVTSPLPLTAHCQKLLMDIIITRAMPTIPTRRPLAHWATMTWFGNQQLVSTLVLISAS